MSNSNRMSKCPYCESDATVMAGESLYDVECPICGRYKYKGWPDIYGELNKDQVASFLYYKKCERNDIHYIISDVNTGNYDNNVRVANIEEIVSAYPSNFANRINDILIGLAKESEYIGDVLELSMEELISRLFVKRFNKGGSLFSEGQKKDQVRLILEYLENSKYIKCSGNAQGVRIVLTPEGWSRIDKLQLDSVSNKNVFVSMAFNIDTNEVRETLRSAIVDSGYSPEFIDEIIHNRQIVPEMFRLIRECKFLILEISDPNYGAYYEAGYALGLGKEVIICCRKSIFTKEFNEDEKHLKPHFDIAQKQILIWDDLDDLKVKLCEWIKAIFG